MWSTKLMKMKTQCKKACSLFSPASSLVETPVAGVGEACKRRTVTQRMSLHDQCAFPALATCNAAGALKKHRQEHQTKSSHASELNRITQPLPHSQLLVLVAQLRDPEHVIHFYHKVLNSVEYLQTSRTERYSTFKFKCKKSFSFSLAARFFEAGVVGAEACKGL